MAHISCERESFAKLNTTKSIGRNVLTASGTLASSTSHIKISGNKVLSDVLYMPGVTKSLLSIGNLADKGHMVVFDSNHCYVMDHRKPFEIFLKGF